jgi:N-acyl-phosphatidylethanolamine-hydrolysing phospholipase D
MCPPAHHRPDGGFRNPWPEAAGDDALRRKIGRVAAEWVLGSHPPDPPPHSLSPATPALANPHAEEGSVRLTWVGHATALIQMPGLNVLTDPVWSERSSPVGFAGPRRFVPAVPALEELPPIDVVLLSHDHYDHLDRPTVRALRDRGEGDTLWLTPLGYRHWFARQGVRRVEERDWWESAVLPGGRYRAVCVPARHWTRRRPGGTNRRLWCGWAIVPTDSAGPQLYFAGDSGYGSFFSEIGRRVGPFHASLMPIGAYEPRWFMAAAHMNPEEAVQAYRDLGGEGAFVGMHWGTWRLTFEDPLEPPARTSAAWEQAGLPGGDLHLLRHGETLVLRGAGF